MNGDFHVDIHPLQQLLEVRGLQPRGRVQMYIDEEILRLSAPMVPFQQGSLMQSGQSGTDVGSGEVIYNAPYARYQYYGKVMAGRAPKKVIGKSISYQGAPQRGALWFERMKASHVKDLLRGAQNVAGGS